MATRALFQLKIKIAFADQFNTKTNKSIVTFPNLGGNAMLVAPCPQAPDSRYGHLASVIRGAPTEQLLALWRAVSRAMQARLSERPVWLSTAGMGVAWLHIRLDDRPKYYTYAPYRQIKVDRNRKPN